jgi:hypothetical protein
MSTIISMRGVVYINYDIRALISYMWVKPEQM